MVLTLNPARRQTGSQLYIAAELFSTASENCNILREVKKIRLDTSSFLVDLSSTEGYLPLACKAMQRYLTIEVTGIKFYPPPLTYSVEDLTYSWAKSVNLNTCGSSSVHHRKRANIRGCFSFSPQHSPYIMFRCPL